jgi:hypothetical protein
MNITTTTNQVNPALAEIRELHADIINAARSTLEKAIRVGELLVEQKTQLEHGAWLPWVSQNLPFTDRTARNYIGCYQNRARLKSENVSNLAGAYLLIEGSKKKAITIPAATVARDTTAEDDDFIIEVVAHIFQTQGRSVSVRDIISAKNHLAELRDKAGGAQ